MVKQTKDDFHKDKPLSIAKLASAGLINKHIDPTWTFVVNKPKPTNTSITVNHPEITMTGFINSLGWLEGYGITVNNQNGKT